MTGLKSKMLVVLAMVVAACGGNDGAEGDALTTSVTPTTTEAVATTTTTSVATTTTVPPPTTTTTAFAFREEEQDLSSVVGGSVRGEAWLVDPGRYVGALGDRLLRFAVSEPSTLYPTDGPIIFGPASPGQPWAEIVIFGEFIGVIPPERASEHPAHDPLIPEYTVAIPEDFGAYLASLGPLVVEGEGAYTGEGYTAVYWDLSVDTALGATYECPFGQCVATLVNAVGGPYMVGTDRLFRVIEFSGNAEGIYGFVQSYPGAFEETLALTDMLIAGLVVEPVG